MIDKDDAQRWDDGCRTDTVRNDFVVPFIASVLMQHRPATVLDVGAGTGYLSRMIDEKLNYRADWTLVDKNEQRLQFAGSSAPSEMRQRLVAGDFADPMLLKEPFEALVISFTLLELGLNEAALNRIDTLCARSGLVIVVLPDVWQDVVAASSHGADFVRQFLDGPVDIPKIDKFTNESYPFRAERIETVISKITALGLALETLEPSQLDQRTTLAMMFRRTSA